MMLVPRRNSFDLFDDFLDDGFYHSKKTELMKTDIRESKDKYMIVIDLPGFERENINISLENGYLNIHAKTQQEHNEGNEDKFLRKERFYGECSRSFYVGEEVLEDEINAVFKNGILKVNIPKKHIPDKKEKKQIVIN